MPVGRCQCLQILPWHIQVPQKQNVAYFSPSWTAFQAERGRDFSVIKDGTPRNHLKRASWEKSCINKDLKTLWDVVGRVTGLPGGDRTPDTQLRRLMLYPTELRADA